MISNCTSTVLKAKLCREGEKLVGKLGERTGVGGRRG